MCCSVLKLVVPMELQNSRNHIIKNSNMNFNVVRTSTQTFNVKSIYDFTNGVCIA